MTSLTSERCEACRPDSIAVTLEERQRFAAQIPQWSLIEIKGEPRLRRTYTVSDYQTSLALTQRIGELAIAEDHHPSILTVWGKVTVTWWTHAIRDLHRNDFIMAAKCDEAYAQIIP
ncbi:MAG: 4a-hydroxytetrahydrobiopterin dehydratase [Thermomicrobiales bacterium]